MNLTIIPKLTELPLTKYFRLYLLYFESQNEENKAAEYIALAAKGHESHGYMGQVARVHHEWLQKKSKQKEAKKQ